MFLDVLVEVAGMLRLVVAVGALLPLYADVVLVGLVQRDAVVRLGLVFAALVGTEPPEHINIVHHGYEPLKGALLLCLVLATKLSASMPSYADATQFGSVLLPPASPCGSSCAPGTNTK